MSIVLVWSGMSGALDHGLAAILGSLVLLVSLIIAIAGSRIVYAGRIDDTYLRLKGCGAAFLASLLPAGDPGMTDPGVLDPGLGLVRRWAQHDDTPIEKRVLMPGRQSPASQHARALDGLITVHQLDSQVSRIRVHQQGVARREQPEGVLARLLVELRARDLKR